MEQTTINKPNDERVNTDKRVNTWRRKAPLETVVNISVSPGWTMGQGANPAPLEVSPAILAIYILEFYPASFGGCQILILSCRYLKWEEEADNYK